MIKIVKHPTCTAVRELDYFSHFEFCFKAGKERVVQLCDIEEDKLYWRGEGIFWKSPNNEIKKFVYSRDTTSQMEKLEPLLHELITNGLGVDDAFAYIALCYPELVE